MIYSDLDPKTQEVYADLDAISKGWPLVMKNGVLRFKANRAVRWLADPANLNDLSRAAQVNEWPEEDMRAVYRMMGYSLCGFLEIFPKNGGRYA